MRRTAEVIGSKRRLLRALGVRVARHVVEGLVAGASCSSGGVSDRRSGDGGEGRVRRAAEVIEGSGERRYRQAAIVLSINFVRRGSGEKPAIAASGGSGKPGGGANYSYIK